VREKGDFLGWTETKRPATRRENTRRHPLDTGAVISTTIKLQGSVGKREATIETAEGTRGTSNGASYV